jgi:hypothetical protein
MGRCVTQLLYFVKKKWAENSDTLPALWIVFNEHFQYYYQDMFVTLEVQAHIPVQLCT